LVEHFLGKEEVTGSIPVISSAKSFESGIGSRYLGGREKYRIII
jgi:hypothetical protein